MTAEHNIPPVWDDHARVLILGSFPSVKSRQGQFFYHHPQNRFWRVLATVLGCETPTTIPEKRAMLLAHGVALWDVIASCEITGSSDSSIRNAVPNDVEPVAANVQAIFCNGQTAFRLYGRFLEPVLGRPAIPPRQSLPAGGEDSQAGGIEIHLCGNPRRGNV